MNRKRVLFIFLVFGIILMLIAIFYLSKTQGKKVLSSLPLIQNHMVTPTPVENLSMTRVGTDLITVTANGFSPDVLEIAKGSQVIWTNNSGTDATVNSDDYPTNKLYPLLNLGMFPNNSSVSLTFDKKGIYTYHDQLHPDKKGVIIVK